MSETKQRQRLSAKLLREHPWCCFCGGGNAATTIDHVPARIMFWQRRRPKGLEIPACQACNSGTRALEQAAAIFARMPMEGMSRHEGRELAEIRAAVDRSFPGWLRELYASKEQLAHTKEELGDHANLVRTVNMSGALVKDALSAVIAKITFGLHYHHSGFVIPKEGTVEVAYGTNVSLAKRPFPQEVLNMLGPIEYLRQGSWTSEMHFGYRAACAPRGEGSIFIGHIGKAVGFCATALAQERKDRTIGGGFRTFRPGDLQHADAMARKRYPSLVRVGSISAPATGSLGFWRTTN